MLKVHEILLTFFYCGKIKKAPGTFGSFMALVFWLALAKLFHDWQISILLQNIFWGIFLTASFIYGCVASPIYTKQFDESDHQTIVLDEVVGQILPLQFVFSFLYHDYFSHPTMMSAHLFFCFVLFRFLDIKKPLFIGFADRNFKNGFGVMFDDLLCGIVVALFAGALFLNHLF